MIQIIDFINVSFIALRSQETVPMNLYQLRQIYFGQFVSAVMLLIETTKYDGDEAAANMPRKMRWLEN
jgi:hypothetical protein